MVANFFMIVQQNKNNEASAVNWKKFDKYAPELDSRAPHNHFLL
jgi:hypothetical protein